MSTRIARLIVVVGGLALILALLAPIARPAVAQRGLTMPAYRELVQAAARASWAQQPVAAPGARLAVLVQLDMAPLAVAGREWDHARRRAYLIELQARQSQVAAAVEARGGTVLARFSQASAGLAVAVDSADTSALTALPGVTAVLRVGDYAADQSTTPATAATLAELSALIGADKVRERGNNGRGVDLAIVDSGLDYTHVKLGGPGSVEAYNRAVCGSAELAPGTPGCAAGLGAPPADLFPNAKVRGGYDYVGDVWPSPDTRCGTRLSCPVPDPNPIDLDGHGTHVGDIAAGLPSTLGADDAGIAPGANLWAFKACNGAAGRCEGVALLAAIDAALDLDRSDQGACTPGVTPGCLVYDPADVITLALSYSYGQPEDALTLFANLAGYYGSLVVASAGNDGDKPYIVGSPATAAAALAVAESRFPGAPATSLQIGGRPLDALHQGWSPAVAGGAQARLRAGDGLGGNNDGCAPLLAWQGALLLERGGCPTEVKAANAAAAGAAFILVADNGRSSAPPALVGDRATLPVFSLAYAEGRRLRTAAASAAVLIGAAPEPPVVEQIAPDASRGPRIADNGLKPDIAAPGAVRSAQAGTGTTVTPFGGSSGAAPVAAGAAALVIQELEDFGVLDAAPGLGVQLPGYPRLSVAPFVKSLLMNQARADLRTQTGELAAYTQQGAGRLDALASFTGRTLAWDATAVISLLAATPTLTGCSVQPYIDLLNYIFFKITPPCAAAYPFGDPFYQAWNSQAGSLSFGYRPTVGYQELSRQVVVYNYSRSPRSYSLSSSLRFANDQARGVGLSVTPASLSLPPAGFQVVTLTMTISPGALRDWTLNGGRLGNSGSASCDSPTPELDCPSLTLFEVDGALLIDGGTNNRVSLPIHVLPRKAADVVLSRQLEDQLILSNFSDYKQGVSDAFALVDVSPNKCDTRDGLCSDVEYIPGARPGIGQSPVDIANVGLRGYGVPGLNAALGLPPTPAGALPDELVEFAITVYDRPYRASPNFPAQFEVHIDATRDGVTDYVAFNADLGDGRDGRSAVFVRDVNPADGVRPTTPYLFTVADFNSQNWVLPVPAAAVDLRSDQPFRFYVLAFDAYFRGSDAAQPWDCSPGLPAACGAGAHTMQTGALRFRPAQLSVTVPAAARSALFFSEDVGGIAGSPSQLGLLLLHRDAPAGRESTKVQLR